MTSMISVHDGASALKVITALARPGSRVVVTGPVYRASKFTIEDFIKTRDERECVVRRNVDSVTVETDGAVVTACPIRRVPGADLVVLVSPELVSDLDLRHIGFAREGERIVRATASPE